MLRREAEPHRDSGTNVVLITQNPVRDLQIGHDGLRGAGTIRRATRPIHLFPLQRPQRRLLRGVPTRL
jgi:hypothetical protein